MFFSVFNPFFSNVVNLVKIHFIVLLLHLSTLLPQPFQFPSRFSLILLTFLPLLLPSPFLPLFPPSPLLLVPLF
ncbi:MAG: hypothetical protein DSY42_03045 [Aquifex sp.]|nr:MAG: hypothetical protein DSY42_03045 [Aquifex sp.]